VSQSLFVTEQVVRTAQARLVGSPYGYIRRISCSYDDGVLTLWGALLA
jgi:hypothetical protein